MIGKNNLYITSVKIFLIGLLGRQLACASSTNDEKELIKYVMHSQYNEFKSLIESKKINPNIEASNGYTLLHIAANKASNIMDEEIKGNLVIVNYLIDHTTIRLDKKNDDDVTFLYEVFDKIIYGKRVKKRIKKGYREIVKTIVEKHQNATNDTIGMNAKNDMEEAPDLVLRKVISEEDEEMLKVLLSCQYIDVNLKSGENKDGKIYYKSLIQSAIETNNPSIVASLLATNKVDLKQEDSFDQNNTLLHVAIKLGNKEIVKELMTYFEKLPKEEAEEWVNKDNQEGYRPLGLAQYQDEKEIITILKNSKYVDEKLADVGWVHIPRNLYWGKKPKKISRKKKMMITMKKIKRTLQVNGAS